ncbi:hypothetical protein R3P38DRAFT_2878571 [Favolaschia claudopus]|uniref:Mixed lineage kinase domain-containing protein n=1 Tax=Favolaschia claudopus TaxID=2862362 RepID=A0AAW0CYM0_9AGAR
MPMTIRPATKRERALQYGTVAATLLKDVGNASNQPYLQAIASISLLIMETVKRVRENKEACMRLTEKAYDLVSAVINICSDSDAELAPTMVRSITQFTETLEKILTFVRSQVKGGIIRRMFRSMEDADLIKQCNDGLKHALDVFGVQSAITAAMTMAVIQKDAKQRQEEVVAILTERHAKRAADGSRSKRHRPRLSVKTDISTMSMLPSSPKIFYGRDDEVKHLVKTIITHACPSSSVPSNSTSTPSAARICVLGAPGLGKTALALAASHSSEVSALFGPQRYFVDCEGDSVAKVRDLKTLVTVIAAQIGLEEEQRGRKHVKRRLEALTKAPVKEVKPEGTEGNTIVEGQEPAQAAEVEAEGTPVLLVLDALDRAWEPLQNRSDIEDFLSILADIKWLTLLVTVRGGSRPRQIKWTRPFLHTLQPLSPNATLATFQDISDVSASTEEEQADLDALLEMTEGNPRNVTQVASLASFEGCSSLVARWRLEGGVGIISDTREDRAIYVESGVLSEEPEDMDMEVEGRTPTVISEEDILALMDPDHYAVRRKRSRRSISSSSYSSSGSSTCSSGNISLDTSTSTLVDDEEERDPRTESIESLIKEPSPTIESVLRRGRGRGTSFEALVRRGSSQLMRLGSLDSRARPQSSMGSNSSGSRRSSRSAASAGGRGSGGDDGRSRVGSADGLLRRTSGVSEGGQIRGATS